MKKLLVSLWLVTLFMVSANAKPSSGSSKAILITIDKYASGGWEGIGSAENDAKAFQTLLSNKYGFNSVELLINGAANRSNIIKKLGEMAATAEEDDNLLILFAGHSLEIDGEGYWIPSDAKNANTEELIANTDIASIFGTSKSKHILFIADGLFAGKSFKSPSFFIENDGKGGYYEKINGLTSRQAITSGSKSPMAGSGENSVFMKYALNYLGINEKPQLDAGEFYNLLRIAVYSNSPNMPRIGHIQNSGHEGGQFIFRITTKKSEEPLADKAEPVVEPKEEKCEIVASIEEGSQVTFRNLKSKIRVVATPTTANYQWFYNNEPTGVKTASIAANKEGTYKVIVSTSATCKEEISSIVTIKLPPADVYINEGNSVEFTMKGELNAVCTSPNVEYEWRNNGVLISKDKSIKVYQSGIYTVTVIQGGKKTAESKADVIVKPRVYRTQEGDEVGSIAKKFYGDASKATIIYQANRLKIQKNKALANGIELLIPLEEAMKENGANIETTLKIAGAQSFAPFSMPGIYNDGIITELVKESFKLIGQKVELDFLSLNQVKGATFNGKYAAAYPCQKSTRDEQVLLFSDPIYQVYNVFFAKKTTKVDFSSPKKLRGKTVAVIRGYNIDEIEKFYKKRYIKIKPYRSLAEAFVALNKKEVDLVATSQIVGFGVIRKTEGLEADDFKTLPQTIGSTTLHLAVSKNHPIGKDIIIAFNQAFKKLQDDGKAGIIIDKHLDKFQDIKP